MPDTGTVKPIRIKGTITPDHKLIADVPEDMQAGEFEFELHPAKAEKKSGLSIVKELIKKSKRILTQGSVKGELRKKLTEI